MQEHSKAKSQHVSDLQSSLEQYKKELSEVMSQLQESRDQQQNMAHAQKAQMDTLVASNNILKVMVTNMGRDHFTYSYWRAAV